MFGVLSLFFRIFDYFDNQVIYIDLVGFVYHLIGNFNIADHLNGLLIETHEVGECDRRVSL